MAFETGVVVFFRVLGPDNNLARSVHPEGRDVAMKYRGSYPEDYTIIDGEGNLLGIYPRDWVACILPLITVGPGNAPN
jgi:hypothetical protein